MKTREDRQAQRAMSCRAHSSAPIIWKTRVCCRIAANCSIAFQTAAWPWKSARRSGIPGEILEKDRPAQLYLIDPWSMDRYSSSLDQIHTQFAKEIESGRLRNMQRRQLGEARGVRGRFSRLGLYRHRSLVRTDLAGTAAVRPQGQPDRPHYRP